jgi:hypothetical protein
MADGHDGRTRDKLQNNYKKLALIQQAFYYKARGLTKMAGMKPCIRD